MKYDRRLWWILPIAGLCLIVADPILVSILGKPAGKTFRPVPPAAKAEPEPMPDPEEKQMDDPAKDDDSQFNFPKKK